MFIYSTVLVYIKIIIDFDLHQIDVFSISVK